MGRPLTVGIVGRVKQRVAGRSDKVVVSYEPHRDGDADPGEVVWGWVPYEEDPSQGKDRPVVVIGRWGADLAAVKLTSKDHPEDPDRIPVGTGAWDPERRPSWACVDRILRFTAGDVRREGCALDEQRFRQLVDELKARQGRRGGGSPRRRRGR